MGPKEEGILLGELKGFRETALAKMAHIDEKVGKVQAEVHGLRNQVQSLNRFRWKVVGYVSGIAFAGQVIVQVAKAYFETKK